MRNFRRVCGINVEMFRNLVIFLCLTFAASSPLNSKRSGLRNEQNDETPFTSLGNNVAVSHYNLKMKPDQQTSTFTGDVDITVSIAKSTNQIQLHSKGLTITKCSLRRQDASTNCTTSINDKTNILTVISPTQLADNSEYVLSLSYSGTLKTRPRSFYKTSYPENDNTKSLFATHFEPLYAREAFPCFDEPRFKATFVVSVLKTNNEKVISNTPYQSSIDDDKVPNTKWDTFEKSQPMPTYAVAFIISELSVNQGSEKVNVWSTSTTSQYTGYVLNQAQKCKKAMESYTEVPRLPKFDIVAVPDIGSYPSSSWGLATFSERFVIVNEPASSTIQKIIVTQAISRQISQHWFGNILTPSKWDHLWLKESLAKYFEYFGAAMIEPTWELDKLFTLEVTKPALWEEITAERPIASTILTPAQLKNSYDVISSDKAASILRMIEHIITPNTFKKAIQYYIINVQNEHAGIASPEYLYDALERQVLADTIKSIPPQTSITKIMKKWTENTGYPIVNVNWKESTKKLSFSQKTYQSSRISQPLPDQEWTIPLTCATKSSPKFESTTPLVWLYDKSEVESSTTIESDEWVICNLQNTGYFRVFYETDNWNKLIAAIRENPEVIPAMSKASLIEDSFAFAQDIADFSYTIPFQLAKVQENDTNPIVWLSLTKQLRKIWSKYNQTEYTTQLYLFIRNIIYNKVLDNVGFQPQNSETTITKKLRTSIYTLLCLLNLHTCSTPALEEYEKNAADISKIHPDLKEFVYCAIIRHAENPEPVWNQLWNIYRNSKIAYERQIALSALVCPKDESLITKSLARMLALVRQEDRTYIVDQLDYSPSSVLAGIKFLKNRIVGYSNPSDQEVETLESILSTIEPYLQTPQHVNYLKSIENDLNNLNEPKLENFKKAVVSARPAAEKREVDMKKEAKSVDKIVADIFDQPSSSDSRSVAQIPPYLYILISLYVTYLRCF